MKRNKECLWFMGALKGSRKCPDKSSVPGSTSWWRTSTQKSHEKNFLFFQGLDKRYP
jgi:hypothetical protein